MRGWSMLSLCLASAAALAGPAPAPPTPRVLAPGVWLIPGGFLEGRQPDGNSVVWKGRTGLVVLDTGRHRWHRQAILELARAQRRPLTAILNSHWHLDHTSGNAELRAAFPGATVLATPAVQRMIRDYFPKGNEGAQAYLDSGQAPPELAEDVRGDLETRRNAAALVPQVAVTASGPRVLDGLALELRVAPTAVTDADLWVYEPRSGLVAVGDLVTLPVPFLDTACAGGWRAALEAVARLPFTTLVPGHGEPMTRARFTAYREAFEAYLDCARGPAPSARCAALWLERSADLRAPEAADEPRTAELAQGYVDFLRANGGDGARCLAPTFPRDGG